MLNIARTPLIAAGLVGFAMVAATIAVAQDNSSSAAQSSGQPSSSTQSSGTPASAAASAPSAQPSATTETNLPQSEASTTRQQANAPVADPEAAAKAAGGQSSAAPASGAQKAGAQNANSPDWPAPQRYEAGRGAGGNAGSGQGGASLGVNVIGGEGGQGIVVARVRPGTPAQQMGLRPRDRITSVNGQAVGSSDEFIAMIRNMKPGDQVELSIVRDEQPTTVRGKLEAFSEALRRPSVARGNDWAPSPLSNDSGNNSLQTTSYEERNQSGRSQSGDVEARLSRVEQQLSQLTRDMAEIRSAIQSSQATTSPALPDAGAAGQTRTHGASPFPPTPGQPPISQPLSK